jgi:hypothetical protein
MNRSGKMPARKPTVKVGEKYGNLTIIEELNKRNSSGNRMYLAKCECGNVCEKATDKLRRKRDPNVYCCKNCPLIPRNGKHLITHGKTKTHEYRLYYLSKQRSKQKNIEFNIDVDDIFIPEFCPILSIKLRKNHTGWAPDAPTLDRILPERGYVKGNIKVISGKANVMKNNATIDELEIFTKNIFKYLQE